MEGVIAKSRYADFDYGRWCNVGGHSVPTRYGIRYVVAFNGAAYRPVILRGHGVPTLREPGYLFGCGVRRRYGFGELNPFGYFSASTAGSCTVSGMITSSPSFQLPGVATV